ncbi:hypothetical protein [Methylobacterium sp. SD21]|uniref:hypothetical protein n=1 Tax=Methylobacterium litchii TaxID=3138810 RepID=UPI00313AC7B4
MSDAAALLPAPDAGADDSDILLRLAEILAGRREGDLSLDEAEALAPRTAYAPEDMADRLLPLALRRT